MHAIDELLPILCCPTCQLDLNIQKNHNKLVCPKCQKEYPLEGGIPVLLPAKGNYDRFGINLFSVDHPQAGRIEYERPKSRFKGSLPYHLPAEIADIFRNGHNSWLLEVGCGVAQNRNFFESQGYRYVGIDIRANGADIVCDAHFLPFKNRTFGAAVSFSTLEHLWNPFIALSEIYRVLAVNAQFAGEAAFLEAFHDTSYFHLSSGGLEVCLSAAGFSVKQIWSGWGVCESIGHYVFKQYRMQYLGRALGRALDGLHKITVIGSNVARRIVGKTPKPTTEVLLSFAGSINWIAFKPDAEEFR